MLPVESLTYHVDDVLDVTFPAAPTPQKTWRGFVGEIRPANVDVDEGSGEPQYVVEFDRDATPPYWMAPGDTPYVWTFRASDVGDDLQVVTVIAGHVRERQLSTKTQSHVDTRVRECTCGAKEYNPSCPRHGAFV